MPETLASAPDFRPPSEETLSLARRLAREFHECVWFRHPEATIRNREDVYLIISHLREYGGHRAWKAAQQLWQCL